MAETLLTIDLHDDSRSAPVNAQHQPNKPLKRKRSSSATPILTPDKKDAQVKALSLEIDALFRYYREMANLEPGFGVNLDISPTKCNSLHAVVALLVEESGLPLSKLVHDIYANLKDKTSVTLSSVKTAVVFVGQRVSYGLPNLDADVLEDDTDSCLWCWETRDLKFMPKSVRGTLKIRRTFRKKIHERITAVSAMITALQKQESDHNYRNDLMKACEKLGKVLTEADIRLLVDSMLKQNGVDMAEKEVKQGEKSLIKQLERNKREVEKEKLRAERELQKEKCRSEKEMKRLKEEAEKDERRCEREESELRKVLRKQQEEAGRDERRRKREEAEFKKKLAVQKQASIMERFLKRSKTNISCPNDKSSCTAAQSDSLSRQSEKMPEAVTQSMDYALSSNDEMKTDDIWKSHISSWQHLGHLLRTNRKQCWGLRQKPKTELYKELKLGTGRAPAHDDKLNMEKLVSGWGDQTSDGRSCISIVDSLPEVDKYTTRKQLLQFDKSHRPAFYGIWPKKSLVVKPRRPFDKDPDLEYDVDSDEEWEEEDPGESLSDCDKDDEEESLGEGCPKPDDEDESEDGFFVPDGYLSENEGVQLDKVETDNEARSSSCCNQNLDSEFSALIQLQRCLQNLTEQALRKNQPLIILNLLHEKVPLLEFEAPVGNQKSEWMCLQALSMRAFPGGGPLITLTDNMQIEEEEASAKPVPSVTAIQDSYIPAFVSVIQSCSQGINKVVESLQHKYPDIPKSQLRSKVREISDFVDNRWQVKKEILKKHGPSISPEKGGRGRAKSIAAFFSKRCMPPAAKHVYPSDSSPQSDSAVKEHQRFNYRCS